MAMVLEDFGFSAEEIDAKLALMTQGGQRYTRQHAANQLRVRRAAAEMEAAEADRRLADRVRQFLALRPDVVRAMLANQLVNAAADRRTDPVIAAASMVLRLSDTEVDAVYAELERVLPVLDAAVQAERDAMRPPLGAPCVVITRRRFKLGGREIDTHEVVDLGKHFWPPGRLAKMLDAGIVDPHPGHLAEVAYASALNGTAAKFAEGLPAPSAPVDDAARKREQARTRKQRQRERAKQEVSA